MNIKLETWQQIADNIKSRQKEGCKHGDWDDLGNRSCRFKKAVREGARCFSCCPHCENEPSCKYYRPSRCNLELQILIERYYEHLAKRLISKLNLKKGG